MRANRKPTLLLAAALLWPCAPAGADAIIVTRAMTASTIAEVFISESEVRVELEIGVRDVKAFRNILPDELYERLGYSPRPFAQRQREFLEKDWVILAGKDKLVGRIRRMAPRRRIKRDEITGEPLPTQPRDAEVTVFVELAYKLDRRPAALTFRALLGSGRLAAAGVGFVVYHRGVAVNDFRYLGGEETLDLDWEDPWYSAFRNRNLWRRYKAPMNGFIYVDGFEVRKEIICRPKDLQQWVDLGLEGQQTIPVADQADIKRKVVQFLSKHHPVTIDGKPAVMQLDRIHFVRRSLRLTGVVDPPEDMPVVSATLGVIFVCPIVELPQQVTMRWDLFGGRIDKVPTVATDEAGGMPWYVTPDDPVLTWQNFLKNPSKHALVDLPTPPGPRKLAIPLIAAGFALALVLIVARHLPSVVRGKVPSWRVMTLLGVCVAGGALTLPYAHAAVPDPRGGAEAVSSENEAQAVSGLLTNIYRAFDYRDEDRIYDTLARSTTGELLSKVYLETKRALVIRSQGGVRTRVKNVEILEVDSIALADAVGFRATCTWNVTGSIGHWGHVHQRTNQYQAEITVEPVEGVWKITDLELLQEQRL